MLLENTSDPVTWDGHLIIITALSRQVPGRLRRGCPQAFARVGFDISATRGGAGKEASLGKSMAAGPGVLLGFWFQDKRL